MLGALGRKLGRSLVHVRKWGVRLLTDSLAILLSPNMLRNSGTQPIMGQSRVRGLLYARDAHTAQ